MSQQIVQGGRRLDPGKVIINAQQPGDGFDYGWKKEYGRLSSCGKTSAAPVSFPGAAFWGNV